MSPEPVVSWTAKPADGYAAQPIPPSAPDDPNWITLDFGDGRKRVTMPDGRTLVVVWISADDLPPDPVRDQLHADLVAITDTKIAAWRRAIDRAVRWLLRFDPPAWQFRVMRHKPDGTDDWALRDVRVIAQVGDWAVTWVAELACRADTPLSIEVKHNAGGTIALTAREGKFVHVVPEVIAK